MPDESKTVNMVDSNGAAHAVPVGSVAAALAQKWRVEGAGQEVDRIAAEKREDDFGGVSGTIAAGGAAVLRGVTAGGSDLVFRGLGEEGDFRNLKEVNPGVSAGGEIAGAVVGALATGGSSLAATPAGAAARLGANIAKGGASTAGRIGRTVAGGAAEGAIVGFGQGVSEVSLSADPLSVERVASTLGSNALLGGALGGGANLAAAGAGKALRSAKKQLDKVAERAAAPGVADDLAGLDAKGIRTARDAEVENLVKAQQGERVAAVDDLVKYERSVKEANPWAVINEGPSAAKFNATTKQIRKALDDVEGLGKSGASVLKPLRVQAGALKEAIENADALTAKLAANSKKMAKDLGEELATLPDNIAEVALDAKLARRYGDWADVKVKKGGALSVSRAEAQRFAQALDSGEILGSGKQSIEKLGGLLEQNQALQARIETSLAAKADLTSPRLVELGDARDALSAGGGPKSMAQQMLSGSVFSGVTGAVASTAIPGAGFLAPLLGGKAAQFVSERLFGTLGKGAAEGAKRASSAVSAFLSVGGKVAPSAPVLATKVLGGVKYTADAKPAAKGTPVKKAGLAELYKTRSDEIRSMTAYGPDGRPMMRQSSRAQIAQNLAPVAMLDPVLADRIETTAARRIEFLASKLPRRPDVAGIQAGPDRWQPSDMEMRTWARYVAAVEDPGGIQERLADGTVTPEDAEAMRAVYPEQFADIVRQIVERLPELQESLPYERRLSLSIFSGVPVDPSMDPRVLSVLQGSFTTEPGTEGGTQAPMPAAQFGSVKNQEATPSQERQGATS